MGFLFCGADGIVLHLSFKVNTWRLFANAMANDRFYHHPDSVLVDRAMTKDTQKGHGR